VSARQRARRHPYRGCSGSPTPDGEVVTNVYDSGGNLASASGVKAVAASGQNHRYHYLQKLHYDKFEQRAFVEQGNGVKTVPRTSRCALA
jgi:hypothetical protein